MTKVPNIKLSDGNKIPIIGLGTWQSKPFEVLNAVKTAIDIGYRHFDCAFLYENENEVGLAIKEKIEDGTIKREDIFVTSKVWNTYHRREKVLECCNLSLKALGLEYLDLYLIHTPNAFKEGSEHLPRNAKGDLIYENIDVKETWKGMEDCYEKGLVKSIGLSNFKCEQIKDILSECKINPTMLQVEYHPYLKQNELIEFCRSHSIAVTGYGSFGSPTRPWAKPDDPSLLDDSRIKEIAEKHNKSPSQVLLRFSVQRGVIVIPKSTKKERIRSNFEIFEFELTSEEMDLIGNFKENFRFFHMTG